MDAIKSSKGIKKNLDAEFEALVYEFLYWVAQLDYLKQHPNLKGVAGYYRDYQYVERIVRRLARKINTFDDNIKGSGS